MSQIRESNLTELPLEIAGTTETGSIRVSPHSYLIAAFLLTFFAGFLIYVEYDTQALICLVAAWVITPLLAFTDRIVNDGEKLYRTGLVPRAWNLLNRRSGLISLDNVQQIETQAIRTLKRGGAVYYRYRTTVSAGSGRFAFASGGDDYRRMVRSLFSAAPENVLDNRSIELRDYLSEPSKVQEQAELVRIPSSEVLEESDDLVTKRSKRKPEARRVAAEDEIEKADLLRDLANQLRLSGSLLQALEAFRRAALLNPGDGWLLFDYSRCLYSYANSERNIKLERKAKAMMRLAENRAQEDPVLLSRMGESYFQYGEWERAKGLFMKAAALPGHSFRALRGLAEIALREGKIAHVIHHFASAMDLADSSALKDWARNESEYFSRLSSDDNYMEAEINRINLLDSMERGKRMSLRTAVIGFFVIILGLITTDSLIANIGWGISTVSLMIWTGLIINKNISSERSPFTN